MALRIYTSWLAPSEASIWDPEVGGVRSDLPCPFSAARGGAVTAYLKNKGTLEAAQHIANHESPRTTKLYDRRSDEISLEEEKISI